MSYIPGSFGLARIGIPDDTPRVVCDGCGMVLRIKADRPPPAWLLDGKAPKGWKFVRDGERRKDMCPRCKQ